MKFIKALLALSMIFTTLTVADTHAATSSNEYELYPTPHLIKYLNKDSKLSSTINVVYDKGIDNDTKNRLVEVFKQKNITISVSENVDNSKTNVLVGIKGSDGFVDRYVNTNLQLTDQNLFSKSDANMVHVEDQTITVLGKDSDSAFYGLTTLYHVVNQMEGMNMHNFHMEDYADIVSRGFIEGYYGNPWSTEDRIKLMEWGGYYKLNSYFYAPKDDPKHNKNWRDLYTTDEINTKIKPLAEAGNKSKCRFVYALHPYMHSPIATNTSSAEYQRDLKIMQAKFKQVIDAGVRQIAILADDAGNKGGQHYIQMLTDMVAWLKQVKKDVPDLKIILPFCTQEYMSWGKEYYSQFPKEVQIVMTGGRVWGEVNANFTNSFTNTVGRGPYLWINWPCSDNSKNHLIMGGYSDFLQTGVDAKNVEGIVLNPMQQSEPSKVAIFGNACYSWNMWETKEEADLAWFNSFDYVDHNSAKDMPAASALRELSKHMINQNMPVQTVRTLQESVELSKKLNPIKEKLNKNTLTVSDIPAIDDLISEFTLLQDAAKIYRKDAGNTAIREQIIYWLNCWDDTTVAAIKYLNAIKGYLSGDKDTLLNESFAASDAFDKSKTYKLWYIDHYEKAEVGVQHIVPFIKAMGTYTSSLLASILNPDHLGEKYITNRVDNHTVGDVKNVFDGKDSTSISYQNSTYNMIKKGQYVGVQYNKAIDINSIRILQGSGKNHFEHCKLQYTLDGNNWQDIPLVNMQNQFTAGQGTPLLIEVSSMNLPDNFKAMGIRCITTQNNSFDSWLEVKEIAINKASQSKINYNVIKHNNMGIHKGPESNLYDGNDSSIVWYKPQGKAGDFVGYDFGKVLSLKSVHAVIGAGDADKYARYTIETSLDGQTYYAVPGFENGYTGANSGKEVHDVDLGGRAARYIRIRNLQDKPNWIKIGELSVEKTNIEYNLIKSNTWTVSQGSENNLFDGNDQTWVWYDTGSTDTYQKGDYIGYNFGKAIPLKSAHIVVGQVDPSKPNKRSDKITKYCIETSVNGRTWEAVKGYDQYTGKANEADVLDIQLENRLAQYIRVRALDSRNTWVFFSEFTVREGIGDARPVIKNINDSLVALSSLGSINMVAKEVTLNKGQYIGLRLPHIYDMKLDHYKQLKALGLKIEATKNNQEWVELSEKGGQFNQVRVVSTKDQLTFNADLVALSYDYISEFSVDYQGPNNDASRDMRTNNKVNNVFDGNLNTTGSITDMQRTDKPITFDLGQVRDFNTIRYYVKETSMDFLRHAKFEVSVNGKDNWQEVLVVGKAGQPNTADTATAKDQNYFIHDSNNPGNMYAEATGLNVKGRYLRVTNLSNYNHRWMDFAEILINGGEYVSPNYAYDVFCDTVEVPHYYPLNAIDGDFNTAFKPTLKEGKAIINYHIKDADAKYKQLRIVQKGELSNALVQVRYANEEQFVTVGLLSQAINDLPLSKTAVEVKIMVDGIAPEILEIIMLENAATSAYKNYLAHLIKVSSSYIEADYTKESWAIHQTALNEAKNVYESSVATQEDVNKVVDELIKAQGQLTKIDPVTVSKEQLLNLMNKANGLKENDYTTGSWDVLNQSLAHAKEIYDDNNASNEQVQSSINVLQQAMDDLVLRENPDKSALEKLVQSVSKLKEKDYTKESWALFNEAYINALQVLANKDATLKEVEDAKGLLEAAFSGLKLATNVTPTVVDKTKLEALVNEVSKLDSNEYTTESYSLLKEALVNANEVLKDTQASQKVVDDAYKALLKAKEGLVKVGVVTPTPDQPQEQLQPPVNNETQQKPTPTGDNHMVEIFVATMLLACGGIFISMRKRKQND